MRAKWGCWQDRFICFNLQFLERGLNNLIPARLKRRTIAAGGRLLARPRPFDQAAARRSDSVFKLLMVV